MGIFKSVDMKQLKWGVIAGVITVGFMAVSYKIGYDRKVCDDVSEVQEQVVEVQDRQVVIAVKKDCSDYETGTLTEGDKEVRKFCEKFEKGKTAFDYMKKLSENNEDFSFDYDESDFGVFLTSVNNFHPDVKNQFWAFLVNGEMSMVGIGDYTVKAGDELTLRVEEVEF